MAGCRFVHVTRVPTRTVMACGAKAKPAMLTASAPGAGAGVVGLGVAGGGVAGRGVAGRGVAGTGVAGGGVAVGRGVGALVGRAVATAAGDGAGDCADARGEPGVAKAPETARLGGAVTAPTLAVGPACAAGGGVAAEPVGLHAVTRMATINPSTHRPLTRIAGYARRRRRDRALTVTIVAAAAPRSASTKNGVAPGPSPDPAPVLVGGMVAALVGAAVADGLLVAATRTADATCQTPPNAAIPSPLVCPAAVSWAK
jgi:hypothetical protein